MIADEINYLMDLDSAGIVVHEGYGAIANNLLEWLATPESTVYGAPSWGHPLVRYKHEPADENTEFLMRSDILTSLERDMPDVRVSEISATNDKNSLDVVKVVLGVNKSYIVAEVTL